MAKNTNAYFIRQTVEERMTIVNADGTTKKAVATGQSDDSRVYNILITTDETVSRTINVYASDGTNDDLIYQFVLPIGAGQSTAVPAVALIQNQALPGLLLDGQQNYYYNLPTGKFLKFALSTGSVTSGKTIFIRTNRGDF